METKFISRSISNNKKGQMSWSTIVVWPGALVARAEVAALEIGRTLAVSDTTAPVVVVVTVAIAITWVVAIAIARVIPIAIVVAGVVALASIVAGESAVAIAGEPSPRRPLLPPVVGRAAARLVVVVEATVVVVAIVASVGKVAAGAA